MKKSTKNIFITVVALLLVATLALAACNKPDVTPPGHVCRHLCSTCDKCSDKSCLDPECADKCNGHESTGGDEPEQPTPPTTQHKCTSKCTICKKCTDTACKEDVCKEKCEGHEPAVQGDYTVVYQAGEGTGTGYTDYSDINYYTVMSPYAMTSPDNDDETEQPEYIMDITAPAGKYFAGWLVNGTTIVASGEVITLTEDVTTLVAQWGDNVTVTLAGLDVSGVYSNLTVGGWIGDYAYGFTQQFSPSANFYLPGDTRDWSTTIYVARDGFKLKGWTCSIHSGVTHPVNSKHELTEDVTFTAVWELSLTTDTEFNGEYECKEGFYVSWAGSTFVRAVIADNKLVLYDDDGDAFETITLNIDGNTATGTNGFLNFTLTLSGNTLTISVKRVVGDPVEGIFTKVR